MKETPTVRSFLIVGFHTAIAIAFAIPCYFVWGKRVVVSLFGVATFAAIFAGSQNIFWVVFILFAYLTIGYFAGIICFVIGLCRFVQLLTAKMKQEKEQSNEFKG